MNPFWKRPYIILGNLQLLCDKPSPLYLILHDPTSLLWLEVVPLYGDMQINPYHYIKYSKNFDKEKWPACESSHPSPQSNLLANLEAIHYKKKKLMFNMDALKCWA
jgi:hypothetical protein